MFKQNHNFDQADLAKNIIDIYKKHALAWTALRGDVLYEKAWLDEFMSYIPRHSKILDLGCGSGKPIAKYVIEQGHSVTGIDSSDVMIDLAQCNFPDQIWLQADMRSIHLTDKFDAILAWDSFFHLTRDDQRLMFNIFDRHSHDHTVLMFTSGAENGEAIGDMFGDALYHASLAPKEYEKLLHQYGFHVIKMKKNDVDCAGHTIWLAQKKEVFSNLY